MVSDGPGGGGRGRRWRTAEGALHLRCTAGTPAAVHARPKQAHARRARAVRARCCHCHACAACSVGGQRRQRSAVQQGVRCWMRCEETQLQGICRALGAAHSLEAVVREFLCHRDAQHHVLKPWLGLLLLLLLLLLGWLWMWRWEGGQGGVVACSHRASKFGNGRAARGRASPAHSSCRIPHGMPRRQTAARQHSSPSPTTGLPFPHTFFFFFPSPSAAGGSGDVPLAEAPGAGARGGGGCGGGGGVSGGVADAARHNASSQQDQAGRQAGRQDMMHTAAQARLPPAAARRPAPPLTRSAI